MDNNKENYILSVVTPFHNTNLAFFEKCLDSLKKQTLGFENIEWVITLHNSEPSMWKGSEICAVNMKMSNCMSFTMTIALRPVPEMSA